MDTFRLNNGLKVYLLQYGESPNVSVRLVISGGKLDETACQVGYSEIIRRLLLETLSEKKNPLLKKESLPECNIYKGQTIFSSICERKELNMKIELLSATLSTLRFNKEKMNRIVSSITDEYTIENVLPQNLLELYSSLAFYGVKHPLGRNFCQYQIDKVLPGELREFYEQNYVPQNAAILVCGNFNPADVKKTIAKHFMKWRAQHTANTVKNEVHKIPVIKNKEIIFVNKRGLDKCLLKWVMPAPSAGSQEHLAFLITRNLFDHYLAMNSLVNDDTLYFSATLHKGHFMELNGTAGQPDLTKAIRFLDTVLNNFQSLRFTQEELQESVNKLKDEYAKNTNPESVLSFYNPLLYDFNAGKNYFPQLCAITLTDIRAIQKKYFKPDVYKLVIIGEEYGLTGQLNALKNVILRQTTDFETCDDACRDVVIIKCHCESCWRRGQYKVWQINPNNAEALKRARSKAKLSDKITGRNK